jgi:hypothetical protein
MNPKTVSVPTEHTSLCGTVTAHGTLVQNYEQTGRNMLHQIGKRTIIAGFTKDKFLEKKNSKFYITKFFLLACEQSSVF